MNKPEVSDDVSANWEKFLEQLVLDYETPPAMGVPHGLQKDAIQNGWGAKVREKGWSFEFRLITLSKGAKLLTMTDAGTFGLTGKVYESYKQFTGAIPEIERLARFEAVFESGGESGAGLFGRGKFIFNAASNSHLIFFDTLTKDGEYRLGMRQFTGRSIERFKPVYQGEDARKKLGDLFEGKLKALTTAGTRIIIVDPTNEVLESINGGSFLSAIEETWWEIIRKYDARITVALADGSVKVAKVPPEYEPLPESTKNGWRVYHVANEPIDVDSTSYRIKHIHFLILPKGKNLPEPLRGVAVYRKGMKVGEIPLSGIPDEIADSFFGYMQLMPDLENILSKEENTTHYGFASRRKAVYRNLRSKCQDHLDIFLQGIGLRKKGGDPDEEAKLAAEEAKADLDDIMSELGIPGFGAGKRKRPNVELRVQDLQFPGESNSLQFGQSIDGFSYLASNASKEEFSGTIEVYTFERDQGRIETLLQPTFLEISPGKEWTSPELRIRVTPKAYPSGKKVGCVAAILDDSKTLVASRRVFFFVETKPERPVELAEISLRSAEWPRENSRRVDYGQSIKNLRYEVENLTGIPMKFRISVRTFWSAEKIDLDSIVLTDLALGPFGSEILSVESITATREKYEEVRQGKIIIRCQMVALEETEFWDKGTRLARNDTPFYLNKDPALGFFEDEEFTPLGPNEPRSKAELVDGVQTWKIVFNTTHPAYLDARQETARLKDYEFEEMVRQTIYVMIRRDQIESLRRLAALDIGDSLDELDPDRLIQEVAYRATDRILSAYYG